MGEIIVKLSELNKKLGSIMSTVGGKNVRLTITKNDVSSMVVSAVNNAFGVYLHLYGVVNGFPMDVETDASLLRSMLALFVPGREYTNVEDSIRITKDDGLFVLKSYGNEFTLPISDLGEIDRIDDKSDLEYVDELKVKYISYYINETAHALESKSAACGGSDARRSSYFIEMDEQLKNIRVTTSDNYRISQRSGPMGSVKYKFVVPGAELKSIISMLGNDDSAVFRIPKNNPILQIVGKDMVAVLPLVSSPFFDISMVTKRLDVNNTATVTVDKGMLINACEMAGLIDNKMIFETKGDFLIVSAMNTTGTVSKTIPLEKRGKNPKKVAFSAKFMLDALKSMRAKKVDIKIEPEKGVCEITPHMEDGSSQKPGKTLEIVTPISI